MSIWTFTGFAAAPFSNVDRDIEFAVEPPFLAAPTEAEFGSARDTGRDFDPLLGFNLGIEGVPRAVIAASRGAQRLARRPRRAILLTGE